MDEFQNIKKDKKININDFCIKMMYIVAFIGFVLPQLNTITSAVIACIMIIISSGKKYYTVLPLAILANDALGSLIIEDVSIYYLFFILFMIMLFFSRIHFYANARFYIVIIISAILNIQLYLSDSLSLERTIITIFLVIWFMSIFINVKKDKEKLKDLCYHFTVTVTLIALSSIISNNATASTGIERIGLVGIGSGMDPNFSSLILNIGISLLLMQQKRNRLLQIIMGSVIICAIIMTGSLTGVLCLSIILLIHFLNEKNIDKKIKKILVVILFIIGIIGIYMSGFIVIENEYVYYLKTRIDMVMLAYSKGDYASVTTGRTDIAQIYLQYFFSQEALKILFGGNPLIAIGSYVPHNTYIGMLLSVGLIGTLFIMAFIILRLNKAYKEYKRENGIGEYFILKLIFLFYSLTLSIYAGPGAAMWIGILLFL